MFRQIQRIPFKSVAIRKPGIGKSELLLADLPATPAFKPLNLIIEKHLLRTDGNYPKLPGNRSPKDNVPTPTERTPKLPSLAFDGKDDRPSCVLGANIFIANQPKPVIQKARGHTSPPIIGNLPQFPFGVVCPFFSSQMYA
jgi:hypothetical protein